MILANIVLPAKDLADAQAVCDKLAIKLHKVILRLSIGIMF